MNRSRSLRMSVGPLRLHSLGPDANLDAVGPTGPANTPPPRQRLEMDLCSAMRRRPLWLGLAALLIGLAGGCASPSRFEPGQSYQVSRIDFRSGQELTLINQSHPAARSPRGRGGPGMKIIEDERMVELLDFLDDWDFFELATPATADGPIASDDALKAITVTMDGRSLALVHELPGAGSSDADRLEALHAIDTEFRYVFNSTHQLFFTDNPEGAEMFQSEKRRSESGRGR